MGVIPALFQLSLMQVGLTPVQLPTMNTRTDVVQVLIDHNALIPEVQHIIIVLIMLGSSWSKGLVNCI